MTRSLRHQLTVLAITLAACHPHGQTTAPAGASGAPSAEAQGLAGKRFVLQSQTGADLLEGAPLGLSFNGAQMSAQVDCNSLFGDYTFHGSKLVMQGMGKTEMGCDAQRHAQDDIVAKFLTSGPTIRLQGPTLTLTNATTTLVLLDRKVAVPDRPVIGTPWQVSMYIEKEAAMGLMSIESPVVVFAPDGTFSVRSPCTEGHGQYVIKADKLTLSTITFTNTVCPQENDAVAADFVRRVFVEGELTAEVDAKQIELMRNPGFGVVAFERE
jgi:heat shock protein HslJ